MEAAPLFEIRSRICACILSHASLRTLVAPVPQLRRAVLALLNGPAAGRDAKAALLRSEEEYYKWQEHSEGDYQCSVSGMLLRGSHKAGSACCW